MTTNHTPEPWHAGRHGTEEAQDASGNLIADFGSIGRAAADRDRAVQCVNALAGIPDPAAELARLRAVEGAANGLLPDAQTAHGPGYPTRPPYDVVVKGLAWRALYEAMDGTAPPDPRDAEIARLREALRPFAEHADLYRDDAPDGDTMLRDRRYPVTIGDLRRARAILTGSGK